MLSLRLPDPGRKVYLRRRVIGFVKIVRLRKVAVIEKIFAIVNLYQTFASSQFD